MINTLRLARRWQEAGLAPEQAGAMVEALQDELDEGAATKADLRVLRAELRAEIKSGIGSLRSTLLWSLLGMFIALTGVIIAVPRLT
jgi:hypothetical protein